ncbi:MAG: hypothetical protein HY812_14390 [Planctomycetes bacterium]|nr:hypothetical protein [Planctomycetota bacterium]
MKRPRRRWWLGAAVCGGLLAAALCALSWEALCIERAQYRERHEEENVLEPLRLALWRMDSWLGSLLALEGSRPFFQYAAYYPSERAYNKMLQSLVPGEVLTPSPLLALRSDYIDLHFQVGAEGEVTSPQVPSGNQADLAQGTLLSQEEIGERQAHLERVRLLLGTALAQEEMRRLRAAPLAAASGAAPEVQLLQEESAQQEADAQQADRSAAEWARREAIANFPPQVQQHLAENTAPFFNEPDAAALHGQLVPLWLSAGAGEQPELLFLRAVQVGKERLVQGFMARWNSLRQTLLDQIGDLFPAAALEPAPGGRGSARRMATLPAVLEVASLPPFAMPWLTPASVTLALTWLAALTAFVAVARTLRSSLAFAERRSRFASSVTHELRTPLTTLCMYSEMLADDMVRDEAARLDYQRTIKEEAVRLANLVENVLAYSRLEEGRSEVETREVTGEELLDAALPALERRARTAGMKLALDVGAAQEARVRTNPEVVLQILLNLVDNACKYAGEGAPRAIDLVAALRGNALRISVRDHGRGVARAERERIFDAFERGARPAGEVQGGVGLGLALGRGLARDLGGDLVLEPGGPGACFTLILPFAASRA